MATNTNRSYEEQERDSIKKVTSVVGSVVLAIFLLWSVLDAFTVIPPGYVGVLFNRWTGGMKVESQGMTAMIPFVTTVQKYPVALRTYTMVKRSEEGSSHNDDSVDLPTKEGQHIRQDLSVTYNTTDTKAAEVFRSFNGQDIEDIEKTFIRRTIITVAQNFAGQMSLSELISSKRDDLQDGIQKKLSVELAKMGFTLDKVNMGASHLPDAIEQQMQQKMKAQQEAQQADYERQKQEALAKAAVAQAHGKADSALIEATAQAQSNKLLSQSITSTLIEWQKMNKWDGKLPQITGSNVPIVNLGGLGGK